MTGTRARRCRLHCLFVVVLLSIAATVQSFEDDQSTNLFPDEAPKVRDCEPVRIEICRGLGYNVTGMPNLVGHDTQEDAKLHLMTFESLINYGCAANLRLFLCSVHVPMCTEKVKDSIGPCRSMCESVRQRCEPILNKFGFVWIPSLNCSRFPPKNNHEHMCMEGPSGDDLPISRSDQHNTVDDPHQDTSALSSLDLCADRRHPEMYHYLNRSAICAQKCYEDVTFSSSNKDFAELWITIWASVCFISTFVTALTFLIDAQRFQYPERPVILLSMCYNLTSIAYIVRLLAGRQVACDTDGGTVPVLIQQGLQNTNCTIVFLLAYFFSTAAALWWVILSLTWFLAAGLKWSHEAIQRHSSYFHLVAWSIPAVKTIIILVMQVVDADELTGMCYVGFSNSMALLSFILIPLCIYFILGVTFLLAGFCALFRIRHQVRRDGGKTERLEMLMVRIGVFGILYAVPASVVIACHFYEYVNRHTWYDPNTTQLPSIEIFALKLLMSLVVGVTSGMWVWSSKTLNSWKSFCSRLCPGNNNPNKTTHFPKYHYQAPIKQPQQQQQQQQQQPLRSLSSPIGHHPHHQQQHNHHLPMGSHQVRVHKSSHGSSSHSKGHGGETLL